MAEYNYEKAFEFTTIYSTISNSKLTEIICETHQNETKIQNNSAEITISNDEFTKKINQTIEILFRETEMTKLKIYEEYDPIIEVYTYYFIYMVQIRKNLIEMLKEENDLSFKTVYETEQINN